jgi:hypothetical protein
MYYSVPKKKLSSIVSRITHVLIGLMDGHLNMQIGMKVFHLQLTKTRVSVIKPKTESGSKNLALGSTVLFANFHQVRLFFPKASLRY